MSRTAHPMAGRTVIIVKGQLAGERYEIRDWYENVKGESWRRGSNQAACDYAGRVVAERLPANDRAVFGRLLDPVKVYIAHDSELGGEVSARRVALVTMADCPTCGFARQFLGKDAEQASGGFRFVCPKDGATLEIHQRSLGSQGS